MVSGLKGATFVAILMSMLVGVFTDGTSGSEARMLSIGKQIENCALREHARIFACLHDVINPQFNIFLTVYIWPIN